MLNEHYCAGCGKVIRGLQAMDRVDKLTYHPNCKPDRSEDNPVNTEARTQFSTGKYKTVSGLQATVARIRSMSGTHWVLDGAIKCPDTGVLIMSSWDMRGKNLRSGPAKLDYDLATEFKGSEQ